MMELENDDVPTAKYVVFDVENTGLFVFKDADGVSVAADADGQPRLAAFGWVLADEFGGPLGGGLMYVKPDGWEMPTEAEAINGLSTEFLMENGVPVGDVLDKWVGFIENGLIAASYNAQFDCKQMRAELRRAGRPDLFEETPNTCLMRASRQLKDYGLVSEKKGWPKLKEVCAFFNIQQEEEHNALSDANNACSVLKHLIVLDLVQDPKVHYAAKPAPSDPVAAITA